MNNRKPFILIVSIVLVGLVTIVSLAGILIPNFYSGETANWRAQSIGQDIVDLFVIVPCLVITSVFAYRNNRKAMLVWVACFAILYTPLLFTVLQFTLTVSLLFIALRWGFHFIPSFIFFCNGDKPSCN